MEFSHTEIKETKEIGQNIYIDIDKDWNLVGMTIEHAKSSGILPSISYDEKSARMAI